MAELLKAIHDVVHGLYPCRPHRIRIESETVRSAVEMLVEKLRAAYPGLPNTRWIALRLLEGDVSVIEAVRNNELASLGHDPMVEKGIDAVRAVAK